MRFAGLVYVNKCLACTDTVQPIPKSFTCILLPLPSPALLTVIFLSFGTGLPSHVMRKRAAESPVSFERRSYRSLVLP